MRKVVITIISLALVGAGVVLAAFFFLNSEASNSATNSSEPEGFNVPDVGTTQEEQAAGGPEDKTLTVTVPKMERLKESTFVNAEGDDEEALKDYAGLHLKGTGFPWQEEANVYLAGHRLGYPATDSFLAFYDQTTSRWATRSTSQTRTARSTPTGSSRIRW